MRRLLVPCLAFAAAALAYAVLVDIAITYLWMSQPAWWNPPLPRIWAALSWMHIAQGIGLVAGSLPVALALRLLPVRRPLVVAFALALVVLVAPGLWDSVPGLLSYRAPMAASVLVDLVKFACVLPLLTWLMLQARRPPSPPRPAWAA